MAALTAIELAWCTRCAGGLLPHTLTPSIDARYPIVRRCPTCGGKGQPATFDAGAARTHAHAWADRTHAEHRSIRDWCYLCQGGLPIG